MKDLNVSVNPGSQSRPATGPERLWLSDMESMSTVNPTREVEGKMLSSHVVPVYHQRPDADQNIVAALVVGRSRAEAIITSGIMCQQMALHAPLLDALMDTIPAYQQLVPDYEARRAIPAYVTALRTFRMASRAHRASVFGQAHFDATERLRKSHSALINSGLCMTPEGAEAIATDYRSGDLGTATTAVQVTKQAMQGLRDEPKPTTVAELEQYYTQHLTEMQVAFVQKVLG